MDIEPPAGISTWSPVQLMLKQVSFNAPPEPAGNPARERETPLPLWPSWPAEESGLVSSADGPAVLADPPLPDPPPLSDGCTQPASRAARASGASTAPRRWTAPLRGRFPLGLGTVPASSDSFGPFTRAEERPVPADTPGQDRPEVITARSVDEGPSAGRCGRREQQGREPLRGGGEPISVGGHERGQVGPAETRPHVRELRRLVGAELRHAGGIGVGGQEHRRVGLAVELVRVHDQLFLAGSGPVVAGRE